MYLLPYCSVGCFCDIIIIASSFLFISWDIILSLNSHLCNLFMLPGSRQLLRVSSRKMLVSVLITISSSEGYQHSFHSPTTQESTAVTTRNKENHLNTSAYDSMLLFSVQQSCKSSHFLCAYYKLTPNHTRQVQGIYLWLRVLVHIVYPPRKTSEQHLILEKAEGGRRWAGLHGCTYVDI